MRSHSKSHYKSHRFNLIKLILVSVFISLCFQIPKAAAWEINPSTDLYIESLLLSNNEILVYSNQTGVLADSSTGMVINQTPLAWGKLNENFKYINVWLEWPDQSFIAFHNQSLYKYNFSFVCTGYLGNTYKSVLEGKASLLVAIKPQTIFIAYISLDYKKALIFWKDYSWTSIKVWMEGEILSPSQVACETYLNKCYLCCFVVPDTFIQCLLYTDEIKRAKKYEADKGKWNIDNVASMKLKYHDSNEFLVCINGSNEKIICNHLTISSSLDISFGTGKTILENVPFFGDDRNYRLEKLNESSYWLSYTSGNYIWAQRFNFDLNHTGNPIVFSDIGPNYTYKIHWLDNVLLLIYDREGYGYFIRREEVPKCSNFCFSTDMSTNSVLTFNHVLTTSKIWFTDLNFNGSFKTITPSENVVIDQEYDIGWTEFEYISRDGMFLERFSYVAVGEVESEYCDGVIFSGIPTDCNCQNTKYKYKGECWDDCYDYLYTDTLNMVCLNCKWFDKYLYEAHCVEEDDIPEGFFISDEDYNVVSQCVSPCKTCEYFEDNCLTYLPCNDGEYQDNDTNPCENCHSSCGTCSMGGSDAATNCDTCAPGYISYNFNPTQCYEECNDSSNERWYIDNDRNVICVPVISCPSQYPIHVPQTNQCVDSCTTSSDCQFCTSQSSDWYIYNDTCVLTCPRNYIPNPSTWICELITEQEIIQSNEDKNNIMDVIFNNITDYWNRSNNVIIIGPDYTVEINSSFNDQDRIDLKQCKNILHNYYNIPPNQNLLVVILELLREEEWTNQVEYMIYTPWGQLVDLNLCKDVKILVKYPVKEPNDLDIPLIEDYLDKGIDIFNSSEDFFNDICYPFTDNNGKDITITDRQNDIYQNVSLCELNCNYKTLNTSNLVVTCECVVKTEVSLKIVKNTINKDFFKNSWTKVLNELNYEIWKCYKMLSDWDNLKENIGFWLFLLLMLLHVPLFVWMGCSGYEPITNYMNNQEKVACPPKQKKWNENEKKTLDRLTSIVENEGTEGDDIIQKETNTWNNNKCNISVRPANKDQTATKKQTTKHKVNEHEKEGINNHKYRDTNTEDIANKKDRNEKVNEDSLVFNRSKGHGTDSVGEDDMNHKNKKDVNIHSKKTTSSFHQNKSKKPPRGSVNEYIQGQKHTFNDSSSDGVLNNQLIFISNKKKKESINNDDHDHDKEDENENESENIETDSAIKGMNNLKNNIHEIKKIQKVASNDIDNRSKNSQLTLINSDYTSSNQVSPKANSKNKNRNNTRIKTSNTCRRTPVNNTNNPTRTKANKGTFVSRNSASPLDIKKSHTTKTNTSLTQQSKFNPRLQTKSGTNVSESLATSNPSPDFLDDFQMEDAIRYDTRSFGMKYYVCLKAKQGIWQTFVFKAPFELKVTRIIMFLFTNSMELAFNTLFYTDSMVSNRYNYKGSVGLWFNLQNSIVVNILSTIASWIWSTLWIFLSNSNSSFKMIYEDSKARKNQAKYTKLVKTGLKRLTVKLSIFIFFEITLMIFFWFYIALFCAVFKNSQISWWQGGLMSWMIGNVIPFGVALFIVYLREIAMKRKWSKVFRWSWWMYRF